jgi:hypothetical protein
MSLSLAKIWTVVFDLGAPHVSLSINANVFMRNSSIHIVLFLNSQVMKW